MLKIILSLSLAFSPLAYASTETDLTAFLAKPADVQTLTPEADVLAAALLKEAGGLDKALEKVVTILNVFHEMNPDAQPFLQLELLSQAFAKKLIAEKPLNPVSMTMLSEYLNTRYASDVERQTAAEAVATRLFNNPALRELNAAFGRLKSKNAKVRAAAEAQWQAAEQIKQVATVPQLLAPGVTAGENAACLITTIDAYGKPTAKERGCIAGTLEAVKWGIGYVLIWGGSASAIAALSMMAGIVDSGAGVIVGNILGLSLPVGTLGSIAWGAGRTLTGARDRARTAGLKNVLLAQLLASQKACDALLK